MATSIPEYKVCETCLYYKFHDNEILCSPKHFTCLCELFKNKYICCKKGYSNLIRSIPYIGIYSPNPEVINTYYIHNSVHTIIENKTILDVLNFAFEQKLEILHMHNFLFNNHPYLQNGTK